MVVLYYTQTYFLDAALETLQSLKKISDLHLLIEIAPESKKSTIIDVSSLDNFNTVETFCRVVDENNYQRFLPYFEGIGSVKFIVHNTNRALSPKTFFTCRKVVKHINSIHPDIIHFDTISLRSLGLIRLAKKFKFHITIHDPVPHTGEQSWKKKLTNYLFYRKANHFFFYSKFALDQFKFYNPNLKKGMSSLRLQPFSYIKQYGGIRKTNSNYILFFGRMSPYKGIDILMQSIPLVLARFPGIKFILAGSQHNYRISESDLSSLHDSVTVVSDYLTSQQLAELIQHSMFIVCPYRDATQSGVLMTAHAFGKPVVATRVGAFPEYIDDGHNGLLSEAEPSLFAQAICQALTDEKYKYYALHVNANFSASDDQNNQQSLLRAYTPSGY